MNGILIISYAISVVGTLLCALFEIQRKGELTLMDALLHLIIVLTPIINSVMFMLFLQLYCADLVIWKRKVK